MNAPDPTDEPTIVHVLNVPEGSPPPRIRLMEFGPETLIESEVDDPAELEAHAHTDDTTWIDIQGLGDEARLRAVAQILGIHDLALGDAVHIPQRAKTHEYPDHVLAVLRAPLSPFAVTDGIPQVCVLLSERYIVTFQERAFGFFDGVRDRIRDPQSLERNGGPAQLTYALANALVDQYYPIVDDISDGLDQLEESILENPTPDLVAELHGLQRQITALRRVARPQVEALYKLSHLNSAIVPETAAVFLKDAEDHARQILGRLDAARDVATDLMNAVLATLGHKQNEVMKLLTLVGAIFIPLTSMAGIYGMNFEYMPELGFRMGYPTLLVAMVVVAIGMVLYFRSRGWLGGGNER